MAQAFHGGVAAQLARKDDLPMGRVYLIGFARAAGAFATGRLPENAAVRGGPTTGPLKQLNSQEVAPAPTAVMARLRELAPLCKNRDTLTPSTRATVTATIAGAVSMLANLGLFFGAFGGGNRSNPLGIVGVLLVAILAPLAAMVVQMAICRAASGCAPTGSARNSAASGCGSLRPWRGSTGRPAGSTTRRPRRTPRPPTSSSSTLCTRRRWTASSRPTRARPSASPACAEWPPRWARRPVPGVESRYSCRAFLRRLW